MTSIAVCTSIFEAARPFVPGYVQGVATLEHALGTPLAVILANDGFVAPEKALGRLSSRPRIVDAPHSGIGAVRRRMIEAALDTEHDILIFCDIDDVLLPGAMGHLAVLATADISYGDLQIIDAMGGMAGPDFFHGAHIPEEVRSPDSVADRNFMGFSNTAVRRAAIPLAAVAIPDRQVAADWWFFTMLLEAGLPARRCPAAVAQYRQHGSNTLGGRPAASLPAVLQRCDLVLDHVAALPPRPSRAAVAERIRRLAQAIRHAPDCWPARLAQACGRPGVWYDDLDAAASFVEPA